METRKIFKMEDYDQEQRRFIDENKLARKLFEVGQQADRLKQELDKGNAEGLQKLDELERQASDLYNKAGELHSNRRVAQNRY